MKFLFALFTTSLLYVLAADGTSADAQVAINAGHLIDPATGEVTADQVVLVEGDEIKAVGADIAIPADATIIDLSDSWVMPGLMDAHVHLTFNGSPGANNANEYVTESSAFRALRGAYNARLVLDVGFTTVKDIGNSAEWVMADVRRAIREGWTTGPTILDAGKIIAPFGGQLRGMTPETGPIWQFEYLDADSPQAIREAVRRNIYYGANTIKLVADSNRYFYSEEEIRAAVDEAARAGLRVSVHVMGGQAARNVILGGAHSIEHGFRMDEELLRLMKKHGTYLVGTDFPAAHLERMGYPGAERAGKKIIERLRLAYDIGVKLAFGTDVLVNFDDTDRAQMNLDYLAVWEAAEIPASRILRAMTTDTADLFDIADQRGAIEQGLKADIIATAQNPLEGIQAIRGVHFVMKNGKVVRQRDAVGMGSE